MNRMRLQLQFATHGRTDKRQLSLALWNLPDLGVTVRQFQLGLGVFNGTALSGGSPLPNRESRSLRYCVIKASEWAKTKPPVGVSGGGQVWSCNFNSGGVGRHVGGDGWRLDVENLHGTNLKR